MELAFGLAGLGIGAVIGLLIGHFWAAGAKALADDRAKQLEMARLQLEASQGLAGRLTADVAKHTAELAAERASAAEKLKVLEDGKQALVDSFKALSADALTTNNAAFLDLAKETLGKFQEAAQGDLEKRNQAIGEVVKPVGEALGKLDEFIREVETKREGAYHKLHAESVLMADAYKELKAEAGKLVSALKAPTVRGRWGEIQLRRVVEIANMVPHCDFTEQLSIEGSEGRLRPDLVVHLPSDKIIVVDSKAPLDSYLAAVEAPDEEQRRLLMVRHAQRVREHVRALSSKGYAEEFATPEFTVLFLPGEHFFAAALEHDPALIEKAAADRVILATPTTLIGLLMAVHYGWQQDRIAKDAQQIADLGRDLYIRLSKFAKNFLGIAKGLRATAESYNKTVATLEGRVLVSARRLQDMGAAPVGLEIPDLEEIELALREPRRLDAPAALVEEEAAE